MAPPLPLRFPLPVPPPSSFIPPLLPSVASSTSPSSAASVTSYGIYPREKKSTPLPSFTSPLPSLSLHRLP